MTQDTTAEQEPLASQQGTPTDYASTPAGELVSSNPARSASMLPPGSMSLLTLAIGHLTATGLVGQIMPELAASYYNNWQGDPCHQRQSGDVASLSCAEASAQWTRTSSNYGLAAALLYVLGILFGGGISDAIGRKPLLVATVAAFFLHVMANIGFYFHWVNLNWYFWTYLLGASFPGSLMFDLWVADSTTPSTRVFFLSVLAAISDGDNLLVPLVGSMMSQVGTILSYAVMYFCVVIPSTALLPESLCHTKRRVLWTSCEGDAVCASVVRPVALLGDGANRFVVFLLVVSGLLSAFTGSNLQVYLREVHGTTRQGYLRIATLGSAATLLSQLFLADPLSKRLGFRGVIGMACGLNLAICVMIVMAPGSLAVMWTTQIFLGLGSIASPVMTALLFSIIPESCRGKLMAEFRAVSTVVSALANYGLSMLFAASSTSSFLSGHPFPALSYVPIAFLNAAVLAALPVAWPAVEQAQVIAGAADKAAKLENTV